MFLEYRPELLADIARLYNEYASHTPGLPPYQAENLEAEFLKPSVDPKRDLVIAGRGGAPVAFAWILPADLSISFIKGPYMNPQDPAAKSLVGETLVEVVKRGSRMGAGSLEGRVVHSAWSDSFSDAGFDRIGHYEKHRLFPLKGSIEVVEAGEGIEIRDWRGGSDIEAVSALFKDGFSGNWDYVPVDRAAWEEIVRDKGFDSRLALLALKGGRPVGYIYGKSFTDPSAITLISAYLISVAVAENQRGKGIGKVLLSKWLRACYEVGARVVYLDVDTVNSAAKSLYGKFGFDFVRREEVWVFRYPQEGKRAMENGSNML